MKASFMARCHPCGHCPWQLIHDDINPPRRVRDPGPQDVVGRVPSRGGTFVLMYSRARPPLTIETDAGWGCDGKTKYSFSLAQAGLIAARGFRARARLHIAAALRGFPANTKSSAKSVLIRNGNHGKTGIPELPPPKRWP